MAHPRSSTRHFFLISPVCAPPLRFTQLQRSTSAHRSRCRAASSGALNVMAVLRKSASRNAHSYTIMDTVSQLAEKWELADGWTCRLASSVADVKFQHL